MSSIPKRTLAKLSTPAAPGERHAQIVEIVCALFAVNSRFNAPQKGAGNSAFRQTVRFCIPFRGILASGNGKSFGSQIISTLNRIKI
jgi:hypothetical protein